MEEREFSTGVRDRGWLGAESGSLLELDFGGVAEGGGKEKLESRNRKLGERRRKEPCWV